MQDVRKLWPMTISWTEKDVHDYICDIGFGKYAQCFRNNAISGKHLTSITPFMLQRIGVKSMQDALTLHASIKATTSRMRYNMENPNTPPNSSYPSVTKGHITYNPKLPPSLQPEKSSAFSPSMPPIPGHPYDIDWRRLCLPYRRDDKNTFDWTPRRPFRIRDDAFVYSTNKRDEWALYNSHILKT
ncbi:MAPKK kinase [Elysia marginata]|uniref:MAPKK kinase n=1 Tax=Elysia marginata TaxID=1093978 RepID=A0AAV4FX31_9GAST|nr:MAPKK kinase [Elysia marginata]